MNDSIFSRFHVRTLLLVLASTLTATAAFAQAGPYSFFALNPCRVVDTRNPNSTNGGPIFTPNSQRNFAVRGNCGVPSTAAAVSINVTIANATAGSFVTVWPSGAARPNVSTINFTQNDPSLANGAIVGLGASPTDLSVYNSSGNVNVIIDVTGYFQ
jgi:hypothetical protein